MEDFNKGLLSGRISKKTVRKSYKSTIFSYQNRRAAG